MPWRPPLVGAELGRIPEGQIDNRPDRIERVFYTLHFLEHMFHWRDGEHVQ